MKKYCMGKIRLWGGPVSLWLPTLLFLLLLTIGLLLGTLALFYREYTEEIERLRRDLLAAREKNGVYMAQENYEQITREIEVQRKEIIDKIGQIKAMEEELARKEEVFQQLQLLYDEQRVLLQTTGEELNATKHHLTATRSKLKQTRRQRDEKSHIITHQTHTEQRLGNQAVQILKAADVSTDHTRKLHAKLDRKRSIEKENERISQEFRHGFTQNVIRMEDSLSRFVTDHTKFLTDISGSFGTLMDKQGRDLSALSELMSSLVKSQSQFSEGIHKTTADGTHSSQEFVKSFLASTRTQANSQTNAQHQFLVENFMPKFQSLASAIQEQGQSMQLLQRTLTTELQQQADLVNVLLTEQRDSMNRLKELALQWDQQTDSELRRITEQQSISIQAMSEFEADTNKHLQMILNLVNSVQQARDNFKSRVNTTNVELAAAVQKAQEERSNFYHIVETSANDFVNKGKDWSGQLETARSTVLQMATASLEKGAIRMQEASKTCSAMEGDVTSQVAASQAAWQELYSAQETDLRKHSDHLNSVLRNHAHMTTESLTALHAAAQTQESLLEEQRADLATQIRERQDDVEGQTTALNDWSHLLANEIKQRNEDVNKLLTEDLRRDMPTGQTPERRDFSYPRFLASTSPHERILERFRQEYQEQTDSEGENEAEFREISRRHVGDQLSAASVHRSVSLSDLANDVHNNSVNVVQLNPLHKSVSVESSLNAEKTKDNKENFIVPQEIPSTSSIPKKRDLKPQNAPGRKVLNPQNSKTQ